MSQTDRQTDKASNWKSAIFDVDDNWSKLDTLPSFVKEVHRQKEVCPTTGKEHFQVHIVCHRQVRLSQMCGWITRTKWFPVIGKEHITNSIKYCSKKESSVEGTHQVLYGEKYLLLHEILFELAKFCLHPVIESSMPVRANEMIGMSWEFVSQRLVERDFRWANRLSVPGIKNAWSWWGSVFSRKLDEFAVETCGASIVEGTTDEEDEYPSEYIFLD